MTDVHSPGEEARILRERARRMARSQDGTIPADTVELIEFRLATERYAFLAADVQDVQPLRELTPLPGTPAFLRGLVNLRGRLVAVVDIKRFFGLPEQGITDLHRILLLRNDALEVGILADAVESVVAVPVESLVAPPPTWSGIRAEAVRGITADGLVVLDAGAILGDPSILIEEDVA